MDAELVFWQRRTSRNVDPPHLKGQAESLVVRGLFQDSERQGWNDALARGRSSITPIGRFGNVENRYGLAGPVALITGWSFPFQVGKVVAEAALGGQMV